MRLDFDPEVDEMSPGEAHDAWSEATNLSLDELQDLQDSEKNQRYLEAATDGREEDDGPIPGGPLADAIALASTPRDEWGPDERAEAAEATDFLDRSVSQFDESQGEDLMPGQEDREPVGEVAIERWGLDPDKRQP
jgi:hypothetical protein